MVADDFIDNETQEFLGKIGIEIGVLGQLAESLNLAFLTTGVGRGQVGGRLILAHRLCDFEALGEHEHERGIDIVDALAILA